MLQACRKPFLVVLPNKNLSVLYFRYIVQGHRKHFSIGPAPVRIYVTLALCKEALAMLVLKRMRSQFIEGSGRHAPGKFGSVYRLSEIVPSTISG